uniref:Uncharacterized protein n=1 Tax=Oryza glumipatula TaxID=40148 RepID=A0A0E0AQF3_9ORYZ
MPSCAAACSRRASGCAPWWAWAPPSKKADQLPRTRAVIAVKKLWRPAAAQAPTPAAAVVVDKDKPNPPCPISRGQPGAGGRQPAAAAPAPRALLATAVARSSGKREAVSRGVGADAWPLDLGIARDFGAVRRRSEDVGGRRRQSRHGACAGARSGGASVRLRAYGLPCWARPEPEDPALLHVNDLFMYVDYSKKCKNFELVTNQPTNHFL